jgi:hypothetical protein
MLKIYSPTIVYSSPQSVPTVLNGAIPGLLQYWVNGLCNAASAGYRIESREKGNSAKAEVHGIQVHY